MPNTNDPLHIPEDGSGAAMPNAAVDITADFTSGSSTDRSATVTHLTGRGMEPKVEVTKTVSASVSVPGYTIDSVIGRGGMGVVYKAHHLALKRAVALKMILSGGHAGPQELARFRTEAEAVARLQHPNIVQIHEVGAAEGLPYCALEFVEGGNLANKLGGQPMPAREASKLVEVLARAMQLAHSRNVVHRDLKPSNILLTADGTPKITDFGLARQLDTDSDETQVGTVMGTPSYMAPEQASGRAHEAGPAADVYALGAILYHCLTGRPPFLGSTVGEMLDLVRTQVPEPPSHWRAGVPLDLDTICLQCLRKEPENRYTSAAGLANELIRYLSGVPILARPVGRVERAVKWVKRNPGVAASLAGLAGIFLMSFALVSWSYWRTGTALRAEADQRVAADEARDTAQREQKAERWGRYRSNISAASAALQLQNSGAARSALDDSPEEHRNWEWQYLHNQLDGAFRVFPVPGGKVQSLTLSPSGRQIAVSCLKHRAVYLYDVATGRLEATLRGHTAPVTSVAYRPDGQQLATASEDQTLRLWDQATGRQTALLQTKIAPPNLDHHPVATYNADGSRIVVATGVELPGDLGAGTTRLWDSSTGQEIAVLANWQDHNHSAAFSPDGKLVAVGSHESVHLCDALTGRRLAVSGPHAKPAERVVYSRDGKRFASTQVYAEESERTVPATTLDFCAIHLWDGETGQSVAVFRGHTAYVTSVQFSPDGSRLVSGGSYPENTARLWDTTTGRMLAALDGHKNSVRAVFSSDSKKVVTYSLDQTARLWDTHTGQLQAVLGGHTGQVWHVIYSPNGTRIVTASEDATLRLWNAHSGELIGVLRGQSDGFHQNCVPVFTPDGTQLITASTDGSVRFWDLNQVERNGILRGHESYVYDVAFSPNGDQVASSAWDGTARLWDATTGRQTDLLKHETRIINSVSYSRDGRRLATGERRRGVSVWEDLATPKPTRDPWFLSVLTEEGGRAALNPAGTLLAVSSVEGRVRLWDASTKQEVAQLVGHDKATTDVAFHPDGRLLATAGFDGTIRLWDVTTHAPVAVLRGHTDIVWRVAFSADGKLLASGGSDKTIRLWDAKTHELLAVVPLGTIVYCVAFSPDGTRLATGCADNTVRLIDVARGQQVAELRGHTDYVHAVAWSTDGIRLVSGSGDFTVRVWDSLSAQTRATQTDKK